MPLSSARRSRSVVAMTTKGLLTAFACLMCAWIMRLANLDPLNLRGVIGHSFRCRSEFFSAEITQFPVFPEPREKKTAENPTISDHLPMAQRLHSSLYIRIYAWRLHQSWRINRTRMRHVPAVPESLIGTAAERTTSKVSFPRSGRVGRRDVLPPFATLVLPDFFFSPVRNLAPGEHSCPARNRVAESIRKRPVVQSNERCTR